MMDQSLRASFSEIDRHLARVLAGTATQAERPPTELYVAYARAMRAQAVAHVSQMLIARTADAAGRAAEALGRRLCAWAAVRAPRPGCR